MGAFATGKYARGLCDRCSFPYPLNELREQIEAGVPNGMLVCEACLDVDHPQLRPEIYLNKPDPQALRDARPGDTRVPHGFAGWNPVAGAAVVVRMGAVRVL